MSKHGKHFDPFVVDSILLGYRMPAATTADKAATVHELTRRGCGDHEIARRLDITVRHVHRLKGQKVEPLGPIPAWCDDYEKEWPKCRAGHELTPDNYIKRRDRTRSRRQCLACERERRKSEWACHKLGETG